MDEAQSEIQRSHCNKCGPDTKHTVVASRHHRDTESDGDGGWVYWDISHEMLECCGCEAVTLRRSVRFSENYPDDIEVTYYPPRTPRRTPAWKSRLPKHIAWLLDEVYVALHADCRSLAMMGARALIDMVMVNRVGDVGNFPEKLSELQKKGFISEKNREVLDAALDMGNAASHRGHRPEAADVNTVMDIVENLLQAILLQGVARRLRESTPAREQRSSNEP